MKSDLYEVFLCGNIILYVQNQNNSFEKAALA